MREFFQSEIENAGELGPLLNGMLDAQQKLADRVEVAEFKLNAHSERLLGLEDAFPAADTEGHRRYHQLMIERIEETRKLRVAIQEKTISGLVWAMLVFLGMAVWQSIQNGIGRGSP